VAEVVDELQRPAQRVGRKGGLELVGQRRVLQALGLPEGERQQLPAWRGRAPPAVAGEPPLHEPAVAGGLLPVGVGRQQPPGHDHRLHQRVEQREARQVATPSR